MPHNIKFGRLKTVRTPSPREAAENPGRVFPGDDVPTFKVADSRDLLRRLLTIIERAGHTAPEAIVLQVMQEVDCWEAIDDSVKVENGEFVLDTTSLG
jgi:hypothetical protein